MSKAYQEEALTIFTSKLISDLVDRGSTSVENLRSGLYVLPPMPTQHEVGDRRR